MHVYILLIKDHSHEEHTTHALLYIQLQHQQTYVYIYYTQNEKHSDYSSDMQYFVINTSMHTMLECYITFVN